MPIATTLLHSFINRKKLHSLFFILWLFSFDNQAQNSSSKDSLIVVPQFHIVTPKDNFSGITNRYGISAEQLQKWNRLKDTLNLPSQLIIGYVYHNLRPQNTMTWADTSHHKVLMDSVKHKINKLLDISFEEKFLLFNAGLRQDSANRSLIISGYVDAYYGYYTDSVGNNNFQKFPTIAPKSNSFGLNLVQLSARYSSAKVRGIFTLHYGDIPASAWSPTYNFLQEANIGIKLMKNTWLDVGFFRTHLGCESIQPRENINVGVAITTYFDPYFLSGAKLSYKPTDKLLLQVSAFNGYNTFVQINKHKTYGLTAIYEASTKLMWSYNVLLSQESPDDAPKTQTRIYHDFFLIYKTPKVDFAVEFNFGMQTNTHLTDSTQTAYMGSGNIIGKYKFGKNKAFFGRVEFYQDTNDMLTGPIYNETHQLIGLNIGGASAGFEIKPTENSYLRTEYRYLQTTNGAKIFRYNGENTTQRMEFLVSTGFWF